MGPAFGLASQILGADAPWWPDRAAKPHRAPPAYPFPATICDPFGLVAQLVRAHA